MDAITALQSRVSVSGRDLIAPAPSPSELEAAFAAALSAPDHGALRPWRFLVVQGDGQADLGQLYVEGLLAQKPAVSAEEIETQRGKALRGPMVIVVAAVVTPHPKVPAIEQIVAGGCAAQALLTAFHAQGYGAVLVTGPRAYDPVVKRGLGLKEEDAIIGFVHVGTAAPERVAKPKSRMAPAEAARAWPR